jgi:5'-nucleotidase
MHTKKFTILHSNDIHGDFFAENKEDKETYIGGLARLSGYVNKVRSEEENVLYVIAGDMLQGNLVDTEYKGISTMEIMNYLSPDVVALGNHEFDYGLPQLLFLERVANFPIVNANLYIKPYGKRLMKPFYIIKKAGLDLLFTGIITEKVMDALKLDQLIGSFITLEEAGREVGKICNAYRNDDIDLTILLTHIGYESDIELAKMLKPEWGVDLIIGGHSHTIMDKPTKINNCLIMQAGTGTDQIGRLDCIVDDDTNSIVDYHWQLVPIDNNIANIDRKLLGFISSFKSKVNQKYNTVLCRLQKQLTHQKREIETTLGNLIADALADIAQTDVILVGAGSIRSKKLGPVVTMMDLMTCFPYDDTLTRFEINGSQLRTMFEHWMRTENRNGEGECYQVNNKVKAKYSDSQHKLLSLVIDQNEVEDDKFYTISLQGYHIKNSANFLNITEKELLESGKTKVVSTSIQEVLEEWLRTPPAGGQNEIHKIEGRLVYEG